MLQVARDEADYVTGADTRDAMERLDRLWEELLPGEHARIERLLVEPVEISAPGDSPRNL